MDTFRLAEAWRYPVKSMQGERLDVAHFDERGVVGDRAYGLIDVETERIVSAKNPRKYPGLLRCRAAFTEPCARGGPVPSVEVTLPDGRVLGGDEIAPEVGEFLGRKVRFASSAPPGTTYEVFVPDVEGLGPEEFVQQLTIETDDPAETVAAFPAALAAEPGSFFDYGPVHILALSTLRRLGELAPGSRFDTRRFRPNLVIDDGERSLFAENDWIGSELHIGDELRLVVTAPSPRCVMTTLPFDDLPRDLDVLKTAARHNRRDFGPLGAFASVGAYARVIRAGTARPGDPIRLVPS